MSNSTTDSQLEGTSDGLESPAGVEGVSGVEDISENAPVNLGVTIPAAVAVLGIVVWGLLDANPSQNFLQIRSAG